MYRIRTSGTESLCSSHIWSLSSSHGPHSNMSCNASRSIDPFCYNFDLDNSKLYFKSFWLIYTYICNFPTPILDNLLDAQTDHLHREKNHKMSTWTSARRDPKHRVRIQRRLHPAMGSCMHVSADISCHGIPMPHKNHKLLPGYLKRNI